MPSTNAQLIAHLEATGVLKTPEIRDAFAAVDRSHFVPPALQEEAYADYPLPIGSEQTISQPTTVAFMLEQLQVKPEQSILDVGAGSGWTCALLAQLVGKKGKVIGTEIVPELVEMGARHLSLFHLPNAEIRQVEEGVLGAPDDAPFDRILVSAAAQKLPQQLVEQLAAPGIMVIPVQGAIWKIIKDKQGKMSEQRFPGFVFVPLKT